MAKGPYVVQGLLVNDCDDVYQASGAVVWVNEISKFVFCLRSYGDHDDALGNGLLQMCFCEDFWVSFYPYLGVLDVRHVDRAHISPVLCCSHKNYVFVRACYFSLGWCVL
jgi:hypothetical protein